MQSVRGWSSVRDHLGSQHCDFQNLVSESATAGPGTFTPDEYFDRAYPKELFVAEFRTAVEGLAGREAQSPHGAERPWEVGRLPLGLHAPSGDSAALARSLEESCSQAAELLDAIRSSECTCRIRNLPSRVTTDQVIRIFRSLKLLDTMEFLFVPRDRNSGFAKGYGFIVFSHENAALHFHRRVHGVFRAWSQHGVLSSKAAVEVDWQAPVQGLQANLKRHTGDVFSVGQAVWLMRGTKVPDVQWRQSWCMKQVQHVRPKTSVHISNLPRTSGFCCYTKYDVALLLDSFGFAGTYNWIYKPEDSKAWANGGEVSERGLSQGVFRMAVVNFLDHQSAQCFIGMINAAEPCQFEPWVAGRPHANWSHWQGLDAQLQQWFKRRVQESQFVPDIFKPLYIVDGQEVAC